MKKLLNSLYVILAFVCIGLGILGILLPILPTTPFLLLALLLFAKGSDRFHKWFMGTILYKKYLEEYINTKAMSVHTKRNVLITLSIIFIIGIVFTPVRWAKLVIAIIWIGHFYVFVFRIKSKDKNIQEENIQEENIQEEIYPQQEGEQEEEVTIQKPQKSQKPWKKIISLFFVISFVVYLLCGGWSNEETKSLPQVKADSLLEDGIYFIPVSLWHATNNAESMGNGALDQVGKLVIKEGEATLYIHLVSFSKFDLTGNLMELDLLQDVTLNEYQYPSTYNLLNSKVISTYATVDTYNAANSTDIVCAGKLYPKVVSVPVTIHSEYSWARVYVPVMGSLGFGEQLCRIKINYSDVSPMTEEQLKLWSEYEISDPKQTDDDTDDVTDPKKEDGDDSKNVVIVDKNVLKTKLDEANALVTQTDIYTEVTIENLKTTIANAKVTFDNTAVTQSVIDSQITALQTAINELVKKATEKLDKNNLKDGKYTVYAALWNATSNQASMGNAALNHTALLTVKEGVYTMELSTHPITVGTITACLQSLQIEQADKTFVDATITAKNNSVEGVAMPSIFSFTMQSKEEYSNVKIDPKVAVMGNDPLPARLKISWDTLTVVAEDAKVEENTTTTTDGLNSSPVDLTDSTTKIRIKAEANVLEAGVSMKVTEILAGLDYITVNSLLSTIGSQFVAYDITLHKANGSILEPSGMVTVYIPLPEEYDIANIAAYRIANGSKTKLSITVEDGYVIFKTNSFQIFSVVDTSKKTTLNKTLSTTKSLTSTQTKKNTSTPNDSIKSNVTDSDLIQEKQSNETTNIVIEQPEKANNTVLMSQMVTYLFLGVAIICSTLITLFVLGFILIESSLRRKKHYDKN